MKQIVYLFIIPLFLSSCSNIKGSGKIITENRNVKDFTAISASAGIDVEVLTGDKTSVQVEADDNVIEYILTKVEGNTLKIRMRSVNLLNAHLKVFVTAPEITGIHVSSSATVIVKDVLKSAGKISLSANSSGDITAMVDAPEIVTDAGSSGTIKVSGRTITHHAEASSSGDVLAEDLLSENTSASASSSGTVKVHASVTLNAKASSSGSVKYRGAAAVTSSTSSSGTVEKE